MNGFNWLDFTVLIGYLAAILAIATVFVKEQHSSSDFFVAARSIPWWAAGMSILATLVSAIGIIGAPADFFRYGLEGFGVWWLATFLAAPIVIMVFIHFFVRLKLTSAYEYLEMRFCLPVRLTGSAFFILMRGLYIGVVIYASALVLEPVTGGAIPVIWLIMIVGVFSALYAVIGGIKAVIWTDVIQLVVVYIGIGWMMISILSLIDGGLSTVWKVAADTRRDFSYLHDSRYWSGDIFKENAFWILLLGLFFNALSQKGVDQLTVQRYLSTRNARESAKALLVDILGAVPIGLMLTVVGMSLYAFYVLHPELIDLKKVNPNSILPHYVATQFPHGLAGLFVAAVMAAVISTVDSGMNCLATVTMTDFHQRFVSRKMSDTESIRWARFWTLIWAVLCTALAVFIWQTAADTITRVSSQMLGLFSGSLLGIFLLGMLVPRVNSQGVAIGALLGTAIAVWSNYFLVRTMPDGQIIHVSFVVPIIFGTVATVIFGWLGSLFFPPPKEKQLAGLTYWHCLKTENTTGASGDECSENS